MTNGTDYQPELGQALFGQQPQKFEVPYIMDAALMCIQREVTRVLGNLTQREADPFANSEAFRCDVFGVWAYDWSDCVQPYNFKHVASGLEISWYKHSCRGLSANMEITPALAASVLSDCIQAMKNLEGHVTDSDFITRRRPMQYGGLRAVPYFDKHEVST